MTGRERIRAAFLEEGVGEFGAVIPYEGIYVRDHWRDLTECPWWYRDSPDIDHQMRWRRDVVSETPSDWITLPGFYRRRDRRNVAVDDHWGRVVLVNAETGEKKRIEEPRIGGWNPQGKVESFRPTHAPETPDAIDALLPTPSPFDPDAFREGGCADLADRILYELENLFPVSSASSPLWNCYGIWGFEGMMTRIAEKPDLVTHACERLLERQLDGVRKAATLGAEAIWIEECMTDMVAPEAYSTLCTPFVARLVEEIRALRMKSVYYFCGNPAGKLDILLSAGADALSLEESKKGFTVDITEVAEYVNGRCVLLGNLDAIGVLPHGAEDELRSELERQVSAGRRNGSRFILSLGSPVTPETSVSRVKLYLDLAHELGRGA